MRQPRPGGKLSLAEMLLILALLPIPAYKDFKHFCLYGLRHQYRHCLETSPDVAGL